MARPIKPIAVRRVDDASNVEVLSSGGQWISITLLGDAAKQALWAACRANGRPRTMPKTAFFWDLGRSPLETAPQVPTTDEPTTQRDNTTEREEDVLEREAPTFDSERQPQPQQSQPPTIEDIVRVVASEVASALDDEVRNVLSNDIANINGRIDSLQLTTETAPQVPLREVVARIELMRQNQPTVVQEGLFHHQFGTLLRLIAAGKHVFMPGGPGTGKTQHTMMSVQAINQKHVVTLKQSDMTAILSLGPTTPESRLWGGMDANGKFFEPPLIQLIRRAMAHEDIIFVFILDEMDNGHPGILATLNTAMANGEVYAPNGDHLTLGKNLVFVACANTFGTGPTAEFSGRNKLDAATLDRFVTLPWETDEGLEAALVRNKIADTGLASAWLDVWRTARQNVKDHGLKVFVTMRGCLNGADLLNGGFTVDDSLGFVLANKVPADQWAKINPL